MEQILFAAGDAHMDSVEAAADTEATASIVDSYQIFVFVGLPVALPSLLRSFVIHRHLAIQDTTLPYLHTCWQVAIR
jgi:hypothetical protein